jgi:hypothetical protein
MALILLCLASAPSVRADSEVYHQVLQLTGLVEVPHPSGLVHPAVGPSTDWALATLLIGAVGVLLLLGIKDRGDRHFTNPTEARTWDINKGAAQGLLPDKYPTRA